MRRRRAHGLDLARRRGELFERAASQEIRAVPGRIHGDGGLLEGREVEDVAGLGGRFALEVGDVEGQEGAGLRVGEVVEFNEHDGRKCRSWLASMRCNKSFC